jgi:hypothetical protein
MSGLWKEKGSGKDGYLERAMWIGQSEVRKEQGSGNRGFGKGWESRKK